MQNEGTARETRVNFPAAFDCEADGRTQWSDVITPQTLLTVEQRPRPVVFAHETVPTGVARDQMRGYFVLPIYFCANPGFDDLTFQYTATNVFKSMADGMECYYFDVFLPTKRATLRITGEGFSVRLQPALPVRRESCRAYELRGFETGHELPRDIATRAVDGRDGLLRQVTTVRGALAIQWELANPRPNTRYKIFFQANPDEKIIDTTPTSEAAQAVQAERYRLMAEYQRGSLDAHLGQFLLAAEGRILDHDADVYALRARAAAVARAAGIPTERLVEFCVPTLD